MRARRRQRAILTLAVLVVVLLGAFAFFLAPAGAGGFGLWERTRKGLDLVGGMHIVFQAHPTAKAQVDDDSMTALVATLTKRVNALGLTEPVIQREGRDRVVVDLPGVKNPEQVATTIGRTAVLEFRYPDTSSEDATPGSAGKVFLTGADLVKAQPAYDPQQGYVVQLTFNDAGAKAMDEFTKTHVGQLMPIYLDGQLLQAPVVREEIPNGQGVITGYATLDDAKSIAVSLNSGALPLKVDIIENRTVSASLGADSLAKSVNAIILGAALVVAFMLLIYRIPGFWADFALAFYALLLFLALYGLGATLTLPGVTGIVLSLGMAVDTNVIIYERIKEELRLGRTLRNAVDQGFRHGFRAVFDSNATTVLAAAVLFWLGTGPIRGFAVTVSLGVLISMFTAITFTRWILHLQVDAGAQPSRWFFAPRAAGEGAGR
ncbi:MAG: protein translocase subunit SecD [Clostridia bacterium]|nr:protein translocase subunit SecD [Clostridia bacterium]